MLKKFYIFFQGKFGSATAELDPYPALSTDQSKQIRIWVVTICVPGLFVVTVKDKLDISCCKLNILLFFRNLANQETARQPDMQSQDQLFFDLMQRFRYP
jgi:hypothetical protein